MMATLTPIANVSVPATVGLQVPLDGGTTGDQTYAVTSSNPAIKATVAQGKFLSIGVSHASSGANDPAFTGTLVFQLFDDLTPLTTSRIESLVQQGFYTSPTTGTSSTFPTKNFHRVANGFPDANGYIVQGGSQSGNGSGALNQPGFPFANEYNQQLVFDGSGVLAMANAGVNTNDSQFFITTSQPRSLDFKYNIFGQLVAGSNVLTEMTNVAKGSDGTTPVDPILFTSTTLSTTNPDGVIHLDATQATAGQTSTIAVTATAADGTTTSQSFTATTVANTDNTGAAINEPAFLQPVTDQVVGQGQSAVFKITGVDAEGNPLTYAVGSGSNGDTTNPTFAAVANATASVDANGVVTVTPNAGFSGPITLDLGVRDNVNRSGTGTGQTIDNINNYDQKVITLTVTPNAAVNLQPIAIPGTATTLTAQPVQVQLQGNTANPESAQTLTYALTAQPAHGTISNFNANTGSFTYSPTNGFVGTETIPFQVTDQGDPGPSLTSPVANEVITVGGANTGAVRLIGNYLVVTPLPKAAGDTSKNTINVDQVNGNIVVTVDGQVDAISPAATDVDHIVVYGSKNGDTINVTQNVTTPTTLDGGHGHGVNTITAGAGSSLIHGFSGRNIVTGSPEDDIIVGRAGHIRVKKSGGNDEIATIVPRPGNRDHTPILPTKIFGTKPLPPKVTFYKFVGKRLVALKRV